MRRKVIHGPQQLHGVKDVAQYRAEHARAIGRLRSRGAVLPECDENAPVVAYISAGVWVIDCQCGAGNATHPDWGIALCFACGATHRNVVFPNNVKAIEAQVLGHAAMKNRNWLPAELRD